MSAPLGKDCEWSRARSWLRVCDRYGIGGTGLADAVAARLREIVAFMRARAAAGNEAYAGHLAAGHHVQYLNDVEYVVAQREAFEG